LLANGAEPGKGTALTRDAHALLSAARGSFQFVGYIEGSDLFTGVVDVVATDGFTGNVVLKTCEGIAEGLFGLVRQELDKTPLARLGSALVAPALRGLAKRIDYTEIGGALLAGVSKPVVIAHGRSDATAMCSAIRAASSFAERALPSQLASALTALSGI
jgi:glycerol-3-phosphate acyltransferase PlsX